MADNNSDQVTRRNLKYFTQQLEYLDLGNKKINTEMVQSVLSYVTGMIFDINSHLEQEQSQQNKMANESIERLLTVLEFQSKSYQQRFEQLTKMITTLDKKIDQNNDQEESSDFENKQKAFMKTVTEYIEKAQKESENIDEKMKEISAVFSSIIQSNEKIEETLTITSQRQSESIESSLKRLDDTIEMNQYKIGTEINELIHTSQKIIEERIDLIVKEISEAMNIMSTQVATKSNTTNDSYFNKLMNSIDQEGKQITSIKDDTLNALKDIMDNQEDVKAEHISRLFDNITDKVDNFRNLCQISVHEFNKFDNAFIEVNGMAEGNLIRLIQAHETIMQISDQFPEYLKEMKHSLKNAYARR